MDQPEVTTDEQSTMPGASTFGMVVAGLALLLPVAFSPSVNSAFWSPRFALALVAAALGVPVLVALAARRDLAALGGAAFVLIALAASLAAQRPVLSIAGGYGDGSGLTIVLASTGLWALGRGLDDRRRRWLENALIVAVCVNVAVAILQQLVSMRSFRLVAPEGAHGLLGNPVHFAALMAGGLAVVGGRFQAQRVRFGVIAALIGAALQFSGSRIGTAAALFVVGATCLQVRQRSIAVFAGLALAGFVIAVAASPVLPQTPDRATVVAKVGDTQWEQMQRRSETWGAGLAALSERPLLGYGPGRFVEAFSPRMPLVVAQAQPDTVYVDAHNIFVEYLVTTGPGGMLALTAFLGLAIARSRGPFRLMALGVLLVYLLQPQSFATVPIAFLALGASHRPAVGEPQRAAKRVGVGLLAPSLAVGAWVLAGDFFYRQADLDFKVADGRRAAQMLRPWPDPASKQGQVRFFNAVARSATPAQQSDGLAAASDWLLEAASRDPAAATYWNNLADLEIFRGKVGSARHAFEEALARNPWSVRALVGLAAIAESNGNASDAQTFAQLATTVVGQATAEHLIEDRLARLSGG